MDSNYMKAVISCYLRFKKQNDVVATEAGRFNADVMGLKGFTTMTEVEIKVTRSDLRNDFKKPKHRYYENKRSHWCPNYFYFAVPEHLAEYAVQLCIGKPYGVIVVKEAQDWYPQKSYVASPTHAESRIKMYEDCHGDKVRNFKYNGKEVLSYEFYCERAFQDRAVVIKRAKAIHTKPIHEKATREVVRRLSSEMANLRQKGELAKETDSE